MAETKPAADAAATTTSEEAPVSAERPEIQTEPTAKKAASKVKAESADAEVAPSSSDAYAIVEASGTQVWLQANRYYDLDRIHADVDATITLDNVLLVTTLHLIALLTGTGEISLVKPPLAELTSQFYQWTNRLTSHKK